METPIPTIPSIPQPQPQKTKSFSAVILIILVLVGLVAGGLIGFALTYSNFNSKLNTMQTQLQGLTQNPSNGAYSNSTYIVNSNVSLSQSVPTS